MDVTYRFNANELTADFIKSIKMLYKDKNIALTIEEQQDETQYLLSSKANRKALEKALKAKEGYRFTLKEFRQLSEDLQNGNKIDFSKLKKVKLSR